MNVESLEYEEKGNQLTNRRIALAEGRKVRARGIALSSGKSAIETIARGTT